MRTDSHPRRVASDEAAHTHVVRPDESIGDAIVAAVAAVSGRSPLPTPASDADDADGDEPLRPLYEVVDPDALDALFRPASSPDSHGLVTFRYCGYEVTVERRGVLTVVEG